MRFWDSSALVALLVDEPRSNAARSTYRGDPEVVVWWGSEVECASALARLDREGGLNADTRRDALRRLDALAASWQEVEPTIRVRRSAIRALRLHPLRAADALQLAAAQAIAEDRPENTALVTLDDRLALAAEREGFSVVIPR